MKKIRINYLILIVLSLFLSQSCATVKNVWEDVASKLPKREPNSTGQTSEQINTGITGYIAVLKTTITGNGKWYDPVGMQAGVIYPFYIINESLTLRAEGNISMQGAKWEEADLKGRTNLLYINAPVVLRYQTDFGLFGEAGLQPGLLVSAKKYEGTIDNYMDYMRKFDFSIPIGIGYEFKSNFGVDLRMVPGISDITKYATEKDRNFVVALRGTYTFKMK